MKLNKLETWGNETTMNMNNIVLTNIQNSMYYKTLIELEDYYEVIDEIYNSVNYLEPFATGSTPSSAYCLLFKLWQLKLNGKQVRGLIEHNDSPYIRGVGLLYLRYVCKPDQLWQWFESSFEDHEELNLTRGPKHTKTTVAKFARMLLESMKFCGTMLPRIPVLIEKQILKNLDGLSKGPVEEVEDDYKPGRRSRSPEARSYRRRSPSPRGSRRRSPSPRGYRRRSRSPGRRSRYRTPSPHRSRNMDKGYDREDKYRRGNGSPDRSRRRSRSRSPKRNEFKESRPLPRYD